MEKNTSSKNPNPSSQDQSPNAGFIKKPVEQRFFDSQLNNKLSGVSPNSPSSYRANSLEEATGFKGFYNANKIYFWVILLGVCIISLLAFLAFKKAPAPTLVQAKVDISIEAPSTVASGGEVVYKIKVQNNDNYKLVQLQLELTYPEGLTYISSSPKSSNLSGTVFDVPDLISGQNVAIIVKAKASGNINDEKQLTAKLHYKYNNFNSEFVKEQSSTIRLAASDVVLELSGPTAANNAQLVIYELKYQNNSDQEIKNARIQIDFPDSFNAANSVPPADLSNNIWNISSLPSGSNGVIQIQGSFKSINPGESKTANAKFLILGPNGDFFTQATASFVTGISNVPLLVSQDLQNSDNKTVVNPGDTLTFTIKYQNNASTAANGVNVVANLNSSALDLSTLKAQGGQISGNSILWNASTIQNLSSLAPSESGTLNFSVQIKNPATRDSSKNLTIVSSVKIKSNEYETYFPGNDLTLKISSPSSVATNLTYSSGALPPQVGQDTIYKVSISLSNSTNDYSDGLLTAFIPLNGGFVSGSVNSNESSKVDFDTSTGKLTWRVGSLPAHTGKFSSSRTLQFQVKLNPSSSSVGQSPLLVKDINFQANDIFTAQTVQISADNINTSDISGQNAYSQGQVVP